MNEIILNIYLIINNGFVIAFRAMGYEREGGDDNKIEYLKGRVKEDYNSAYKFDAPQNEKGEFMKYTKFAKLEKRGMHFQLFEEIFSHFDVLEHPLICVTPVVDGKFLTAE
jgi:hypothetical protein